MVCAKLRAAATREWKVRILRMPKRSIASINAPGAMPVSAMPGSVRPSRLTATKTR
ncbi:hypothetical protein SAMN05421812_1253 [Asanoa hainanensis]|uniref:Uncharacterized protein n=1 Tax=Asanoa hainanensis TaxID=560556 RepID=A0A239PF46_9ACTN|nr:hypothetical protein SAMN05421812_1253 [Asanoa hainanensis]